MQTKLDNLFKFKLGEIITSTLPNPNNTKFIITNRLINESNNGYIIEYYCGSNNLNEDIVCNELEIKTCEI